MFPNTSAPIARKDWVVVVAGPSHERGEMDAEAFKALSEASEAARVFLGAVFGGERVVEVKPMSLEAGGLAWRPGGNY